MNKGTFITFEGGEGSGKTSLIFNLKEHFESLGYTVMVTREPGGVKVAEDIREVIMSSEMDTMTEALLFASARREHLVERVLPALERGEIVLCDRFVHSSIVYQGMVKELGVKTVADINAFAIGDNMPDMTIIMDLDPQVGLNRISANSEREVNRWDLEKLDFHEKLRKSYQSLKTLFPEQNIVSIDATPSQNEVFDVAKSVVESFLNKQHHKVS
ncbi:dTMP kinase [Rossellomorea marisflavi]|uniref:dTMP kinase n=1 Tax=Rossellomorea marisflavi TaxID=189381 RepID=UPI003FA0F615